MSWLYKTLAELENWLSFGGKRMTRHLGKKPAQFDHRTLRLAKYLDKLPAPPPAIDHLSRVTAPGMMGNDSLGDCVVAAAAHQIQCWSVYAERGQQTVPDATIIGVYNQLSPDDSGLNMLDWLNFWRKTGLGGDLIEGFAALDVNLLQMKLAIQLFGSAFIGMSLPDANTFGPWTTIQGPPNPNNGHAVAVSGYSDATQSFRCITWGEAVDLSYSWFLKYCDEPYVVLNDLELLASRLSPEGFDLKTLQADLAQIKSPVTPPPTPVPPAPAPSAGDWSILVESTGKSFGPFADAPSATAWANRKYAGGGYTLLKRSTPT